MAELLSINQMTGIHRETDPAEIPDGACVSCRNVLFDRGTIVVRPGRARHSAVPTTSPVQTAGSRCLFETANGVDNPPVRLIAGIGTKLFATHTTTQTFTSFYELNTTVGTANRVRFAQFNERVYFVDGVAATKVKYANCTSISGGKINVTELTTPIAPTVAPGLAQSYAQYRLIDCRNGDADGQGYGFYDTGTIHQSEVSFPSALCAYSAAYNSDVDGACVRGMTAAANVYTGQTASLALEIYDGTGGNNITGNVRFYRILPEARDLSQATTITIRMMAKAGSGDAFPDALNICISEDGVTWTEYLVDTTGYVKDTWYTATVDISATAASARDAIRYVGVRCGGIETKATDRLEQTATMYRPLETSAWTLLLDTLETDIVEAVFAAGTYDVTYTYVSPDGESRPYMTDDIEQPYPQFILNTGDCIGLTINPTLDAAATTVTAINLYVRGGSASKFLQVTSFAVPGGAPYSYAWDGQYPEGAPALLEIDVFSEAPPTACTHIFADKGRMLYIANNPVANSGYADTLYVSNLEDPARVSMRRMAEASTVYGFYQAVGQDGAAVTGVGALAGEVVLFKGRGAYLFNGTDSNSFGITRLTTEHGCISHESIQQVEGGFLAWMDIDRIWAWDGKEFTDLGAPVTPILAGYTYAQKAASFSIYDPARRLLIFTIPAVGSLYGSATGTLTTGSKIVTGIASTTGLSAGMSVQGTGIAAGCTIATVDSGTQITLSVNATATGAQTLTFQVVTPSAESLVLDLSAGYWTHWTEQPGGCAIYAGRAATPGVYAGDPYGAAGAGYLYRMNTGLVDATSASASVAIAWNWFSKYFDAPTRGYEKDVQELLVLLGTHGTGESLTLYVRPNGDTTGQATKSIAIRESASTFGQVAWWPTAILGAETVQLGIAGSTTAGCEVRRIDARIARGQRVR